MKQILTIEANIGNLDTDVWIEHIRRTVAQSHLCPCPGSVIVKRVVIPSPAPKRRIYRKGLRKGQERTTSIF
jgi:hypothetical protein